MGSDSLSNSKIGLQNLGRQNLIRTGTAVVVCQPCCDYRPLISEAILHTGMFEDAECEVGGLLGVMQSSWSNYGLHNKSGMSREIECVP